MKVILTWFGLSNHPAPSEDQKLHSSFKTTYPDNQPSLDDWMQEFRVSMLHGREAVYM